MILVNRHVCTVMSYHVRGAEGASPVIVLTYNALPVQVKKGRRSGCFAFPNSLALASWCW